MTGDKEFEAWTEELEYPVRKEKLIQYATGRGFDTDEVRRALEATPVEEFNSPSSVREALAKLSFPGA